MVARLEKEQWTHAVTHRKVSRPWGWYESIDMGERLKVKRIGIKPGTSLSPQMRYHRVEHWVVVTAWRRSRAAATPSCSARTRRSPYTPIEEVRRLSNPGLVELQIIEI